MSEPMRLYAIARAEDIKPGDLVFYQDSERYVQSVRGKAPSSIRITTIQRSWPYLSVVNVHEPEDEMPACRYTLVINDGWSPPSLLDYDREQGINDAIEARTKYENRTP